MGSKCILDTPELLGESLIPISAAGEEMPMENSRATRERWMREGIRGVVLESILLGGKRFTSKEAIARFLRAQLRVDAERAAPTRSNRSKKDIAEAARKFGLPEPQKGSANEGA